MAEFKYRSELASFEIAERAPIDAALTAMGVPEDELALWTVEAGNKPLGDNYREVSVDPGRISRAMREAIGGSIETVQDQWRYCEQFKHFTSGAILAQMAIRAAFKGEAPKPAPNKPSQKLPITNGLVVGGSVALVTHNPVFGLVMGTFGYSHMAIAQKKRAKEPASPELKLLESLQPRADILQHEIGKVLKPIYTDIIDSVA